MFRSNSYSILVVAITAALAVAGPAHGDVRVGHAYVSHADLNLADPRDAHIMLDRLQRAARWACGANPKFTTNYRTAPNYFERAFDVCTADALRRAVADVNAPLVTRAYAKVDSDTRLARH